MAGFGGAVKLTGESEYKKALKQITQNLKEVSSEMKVVKTEFDKNDTSVKALTAKEEVLNKKLQEQTSKLNLVQTEYKRLQDQYAENTKKHDALVASYDKEKAELDKIEAELGTSSKEYEEQKKKVDALEAEVAKSTTTQEANEKALSNMRVEMNKAQADVNKTTGEISKLDEQLKLSKEEEEKATTATAELTQKIADQESDLAKLKNEYKDAVIQWGKDSEAAKNLGTQIDNLSTDLKENKDKMDAADKSADELDKSLGEAKASAEKADGGFTVLKGTLADLASAGIQQIADAMKQFADTAIEAWKEYDSGTDIVIAKTGATGKVAEELEDVFVSVSGKIVASQEDIGTAVGEVSTRFGLTGDDLDKLSTKFLEFSKLNQTDVNTSIDNTQKALSAFGLDANSAGDVLDIFNKVGQDTGVSMDTLMTGLVQNGTAFQDMGLNIEQSTVLMGQMEKSGANSETVMNGLRKALKNAASEGKPLNEALGDLEDEIKNNTNETDGLNKAYELFGKSGDQIYGALKNGTLSFKDIASASTDFKGSVEKTFDKTQDGPEKFQLAIQKIKTRMATMVGDLMDKYSPQIEKALNTIGKVVEKLFPAIEKGIDFFIKHGETIVIILKSMAAGVATYFAYTTAIKVMTEGWKALTVVQKAVTAAQWLMNTAMSANPIGLIVAAVVALIAAFVLLWKKSDAFREFWKNLWEGIKNVASDLWDAIVGIFSAAWEAIKEVWNAVKGFFQGIWDGIKKVFEGVGTWFKEKFQTAWTNIKNIWNGVKGFFQGIWDGIKKVFNGVHTWFRDKFKDAWEKIKGVFTGVGKFFGGIWDTIKEKFKNIGQKIGDAIGKAFKKAINSVLATAENVLNAPIRAINKLIGKLQEFGLDIGYLDEFSLPRMETGGVLKKGQIGLLEGSGAEAVVPLEKNTQWIRRVADEMKESLMGVRSSMSGGTDFVGDEITINVYAPDGMDVNALAVAVEQRLTLTQKQRKEVWA